MSNQRDRIEEEHLSYSQLNEYSACPRKYFLKRIVKIPARPAYAMVSGKALHAGLEQHNVGLLQGEDVTLENIIEIGAEHVKACPEGDDLELPRGEAVDKFVAEAKPPIGSYLETEEKKILDADIIGIEEEIKFMLAGQPCIGYIDLHTTAGVWDYKMVGRSKTEKEVAVDPQLIIYKRVTGVKNAGLACMYRGKPVSKLMTQPDNEVITAGVMDWAESIARGIAESKKSGVWPRCDPRNWVCGETCPFYFHCFKKEN